MVLSQRVLSELRARVAGDTRRAGLHPTTLSHILNDALPLRVGDVRVGTGTELRLQPEECFTPSDSGSLGEVCDAVTPIQRTIGVKVSTHVRERSARAIPWGTTV